VVERSSDWLAQPKRDLENARYEMDGQFYEWACFLCQQSAEKAVKAVYQRAGAEAFGHSVAGLLARLPLLNTKEKQREITDEERKKRSELTDLAKELDKAYISARYPNSHPEGAPFNSYTLTEAKRSIENAEKILRLCEDLLSSI